MTILYTFLVYAFTADHISGFHIGFLPARVKTILGVLLIVLGVPLWVLSGLKVVKGFSAGKLCTTGVYGLCRHPLYAAWALLIVPGIVLLTDNWFALTIPLLMCFLLMMMVGEEDKWLESRFGARYRAYRKGVPTLLPVGWFLKDN
jgi:protein-S-isoprenylcysteine O-methyltransferase Ste14